MPGGRESRRFYTAEMIRTLFVSSPARVMVLCLLVIVCLSGCAVVAVADLAVTTVSTVVSTGVKATGAVIDAVIADSSSKK
ncbi:MAG: hypothetical protein RL163_1893 [Pseudomonadota bacterium]